MEKMFIRFYIFIPLSILRASFVQITLFRALFFYLILRYLRDIERRGEESEESEKYEKPYSFSVLS